MMQSKRRSNESYDDCQDRVCSDTKKSFNAWMKQGPTSQDQCPLDREGLGRATWSLLHTMSVSYPQKPTERDKTNMRDFIRLMSELYPCKDCAKDFRDDIRDMPPKLESRAELSLWFCQLHNKVNKKLSKPEFDCDKVDERWRTGWKDGSCA